MRNLLFITLLSLVITPIVALQEELSGGNNAQPSMHSQIMYSVDRMGIEAANFLDKAERRIASVFDDMRR